MDENTKIVVKQLREAGEDHRFKAGYDRDRRYHTLEDTAADAIERLSRERDEAVQNELRAIAEKMGHSLERQRAEAALATERERATREIADAERERDEAREQLARVAKRNSELYEEVATERARADALQAERDKLFAVGGEAAGDAVQNFRLLQDMEARALAAERRAERLVKALRGMLAATNGVLALNGSSQVIREAEFDARAALEPEESAQEEAARLDAAREEANRRLSEESHAEG